MTRTPTQRTRQRLMGSACMGLTLGLMFLGIGLNRPTIANMRTIDIIHLVATGACLGAGFTGLVVNFASRREG